VIHDSTATREVSIHEVYFRIAMSRTVYGNRFHDNRQGAYIQANAKYTVCEFVHVIVAETMDRRWADDYWTIWEIETGPNIT
jgi:hypothetical protein